MSRGRFIVLDGIDGAGTTTQGARLHSWFRSRGVPCHLTMEPSAGPIGALIRQVLTGRVVGGSTWRQTPPPLSADAVALLFAADRIDHLAGDVDPYLARGYVVISDRYLLSSLAYQGFESDRRWVEALNQRARTPDLTVILDLPAEQAEARRNHSRGMVGERYDKLEIQRELAERYRQLAADQSAEPRVLVPGAGSEEEVFDALVAVLTEHGFLG